ncbi:MAG: ABC transporter permease [Bacteroidota bacterium]
MLKNYFKIALRSLIKQRVFTLINTLGLTIAVAVCLMIYLYVQNETNYDGFHKNSENIYRLLRVGEINDEKYLIGVTSVPFADALVNDFPNEIEQTTKVYPNDGLVTFEDKSFLENKLFLADSNFLQVFSFPLERGDRSTALDLPNSVILTKATAEKYFGEADPIGKIIQVDGQIDLQVTGVLGAFPTRSHLDFDLVTNIAVVRNNRGYNDWWNNRLITYVVLKDGVSQASLEPQFPSFMDKYFGEDFERNQARVDITLQPLANVYFEHNVRYDRILHGNRSSVVIFTIIGLFIIVVACVNFMNLATAKSVLRAREVGVRKTMGSTRASLIGQFLGESMIISLLSVVLGAMVVELALPLFNQRFGLELVFHPWAPEMLLTMSLFVALLGICSGSYPAFLLSNYKPVKVLKGQMKSGPSSKNLRKALVILQFTISVFLIICTFFVGDQLGLLRNKDLGFSAEQVVLVDVNNAPLYQNRETFKIQLLQSPYVKSVSKATGEPGGMHDTMSFDIEGQEEAIRMRTLFCDYDYAPTMDIDFVAGRNFSEEYGTDLSGAAIINERAARALGLTPDEVIGRSLVNVMMDTVPKTIVGVVKDYNFASLHNEILPLVITMTQGARVFAIKVDGQQFKGAISDIESAWKAIAPQYPFDYRMLDESFYDLYQNERIQGQLFSLFSKVSIFIACLGIIGLASFSAAQRIKEIGIRKALGASVANISYLLSGDFLKLIIIANVIAWPLAWWAMNTWLTDFAYRIKLGAEVFVISCIISLVIALAAISYQTVSAALTNPVDSLKEDG